MGFWGIFTKHRTPAQTTVVAEVMQPGEGGPATLETPRLAQPPRSRIGFLSFLPGARRDAAISQLQRGFDELVELIQTLRSHMNQQSQRADRMLDIMERLPMALEALPETNRNQARLVEALHTYLEQHGKQTYRLHEAVGSLARATEQQSGVLNLMQAQVQDSRELDQQRFASINAVNESLHHLGANSEMSIETLRRICESSQQNDSRMEHLIERQARHMNVLTAVFSIVVLIALGAAVYALWLINSQ